MSAATMLAAAELALRENRTIVQGDARGTTVTVSAAELKALLAPQRLDDPINGPRNA